MKVTWLVRERLRNAKPFFTKEQREAAAKAFAEAERIHGPITVFCGPV